MCSIIPSEYIDVEYLLALSYKTKDDIKEGVLTRIEQIRRMHANFRLRLYRPLQLAFGKQSLHNEPIYEGEEENAGQALTPFTSSPVSFDCSNSPSRPLTSTFNRPATAPSVDVFDLIGVTPSTSISHDVVNYGVAKDPSIVPQPQWPTSTTSTFNVVQPPTAVVNGSATPTANQININTNW
ncbi:unnamed protein product [Strongylus vulgaris]|uniref:Uncharacterized protein n=1 Tax=Strongylus vulgaris TaxID=40348 RepID=A0A3P7IL77_STRVU|nr:unnamed protein product [Strongylus vulgaris]